MPMRTKRRRKLDSQGHIYTTLFFGFDSFFLFLKEILCPTVCGKSVWFACESSFRSLTVLSVLSRLRILILIWDCLLFLTEAMLWFFEAFIHLREAVIKRKPFVSLVSSLSSRWMIGVVRWRKQTGAGKRRLKAGWTTSVGDPVLL